MERHLFYICYELDLEPFRNNLSEGTLHINTRNGAKILYRYGYMLYESESLKFGMYDYNQIEKTVVSKLVCNFGINLEDFGYNGINIHCIFCVDTCTRLMEGKECSFTVRYMYTTENTYVNYGSCIYTHKCISLKERKLGMVSDFDKNIEFARSQIISMLKNIHAEVIGGLQVKVDSIGVLFMYDLE